MYRPTNPITDPMDQQNVISIGNETTMRKQISWSQCTEEKKLSIQNQTQR